VPLVQLDEPVLADVVFTGAKNTRSFMCGALSEKGDVAVELAFAQTLLAQVAKDCRGNWTRAQRVAWASAS
jgi:5-methyltetrahydropteroyltriglutamate--homocysteine methyltransferase